MWLNILPCIGQLSTQQQRIIQPKLSIVLRLRSRGLKVHSPPIRLAEIKYSDTPSTGKDVEKPNRITRALLVGRYNGIATQENSLVVSYKTKPAITVTQQLHSWAFNQAKWKFMFPQKLVHKYSKQLYS